MQKLKIIFLVLFLLIGFSTSAQNLGVSSSLTDSLVTSIKIRKLQSERDKLKSQIETEDQKRNLKDDSKSSEELEAINMQQDSICLSLRSKLVAVDLQLKELQPKTIDAVTSVYNSLINKPQKEPAKEQQNPPLK